MGSVSSPLGQLIPITMGDMANAVCMADGFEKIQKLPDPVPGCPNFRRVPGFKVYCCGQPTIAGFEAALNKVCGDKYPKDGPIIWFNLRQEPDVYENGGKLKVVDINKKQSEIEVKELKSLSQVIDGLKEKFPGLVHWRVPVCNSASPLESDFDIMVKTLVGTAINTPVIV